MEVSRGPAGCMCLLDDDWSNIDAAKAYIAGQPASAWPEEDLQVTTAAAAAAASAQDKGVPRPQRLNTARGEESTHQWPAGRRTAGSAASRAAAAAAAGGSRRAAGSAPSMRTARPLKRTTPVLMKLYFYYNDYSTIINMKHGQKEVRQS